MRIASWAYVAAVGQKPKLVEFAKKDGLMKTTVEYSESLDKSMGAPAKVSWNSDLLCVSSVEGNLESESYGLVALPTKSE